MECLDSDISSGVPLQDPIYVKGMFLKLALTEVVESLYEVWCEVLL